MKDDPFPEDKVMTSQKESNMKAGWLYISATIIVMTFSSLPVFADEGLAKNYRCLECHSSNKVKVGPSFRKISERYRGDATARSQLIQRVKQGSKGNWTDITGGVPMPPYSGRLTNTEIEQLVDWVLSH